MIPAVPAWNGNIGLDFQVNDTWTLSYSAIYTGARYPSEDEDNTYGKLSPYWINNFAIQYRINQIKIGLEFANLFNQRYPTYVLYDPTKGTSIYYPGSGRSILLTTDISLSECE